jgi:hypothetical protein
MSALSLKADILSVEIDVRYLPKAEMEGFPVVVRAP